MSKNENTVSDIFVKKIVDKMGNILTKDEIMTLWLRSGGSQSRTAYALGILIGRGFLEKVANSIYIVKDKGTLFDIGKTYWTLIRKMINIYSPSGGVIGGEKALELHLQNFSIPDILIIYTRDVAMRIRMTDGREVHFRTLVSGPKTGKKNLWGTLMNYAIFLDNPEKIQICGKELALLEALSLRRHDIGIEEANIARFLRSFHSDISRSHLGFLTKLRYIRPLNRLRILSRDLGYMDIYAMTLEIIRDEGGGCYLNL